MLKSVLKSFTVSRALIALFGALGYFLFSTVQDGMLTPLAEPAPWFLSIWYQWDANWYMSIASEGYQWVEGDQSNIAFFPLYPLLVRAAGMVSGGRYLLSGLLLSSVFLFAGMIFLYRLVREDYSQEIAGRTVWLMAIFPTSLFFSSLYSESLFLLTSVASFYYARRGKWAMAGFWGLLAALTRVTGLWLLVPLGWEFLSQKGFSLKKLNPAALWLGLLPAGIVLYVTYLYFGFGKPFAFAETQAAGWGHELTTVWAAVRRDLGFLFDNSEYWVIYELTAVALVIVCAGLGLRKLRGSYTIYMLVSLLVPILSGTTRSMSRYILVLFPVFILMAQLTKRPAARYAVYAASLLLLAISTAAFATGRWVA